MLAIGAVMAVERVAWGSRGQISKMLLIVLLIGIDERAEARTALHAILAHVCPIATIEQRKVPDFP
jgi:hypothetical protein